MSAPHRKRRKSYILTALKRPVSDAAKAHLVVTNQSDWLARLTVRKGDRDVFRFWQPGGGYDRNIYSDDELIEKISYIHNNPVRRGLVERAIDWPWSSARWWEARDEGHLRIDELVL
ncbi:MAG: hypothetical protein GC159_18485 [Phycisphaera sp.]|nr:hypothetical protein [Phycisphaera sp.]